MSTDDFKGIRASTQVSIHDLKGLTFRMTHVGKVAVESEYATIYIKPEDVAEFVRRLVATTRLPRGDTLL